MSFKKSENIESMIYDYSNDNNGLEDFKKRDSERIETAKEINSLLKDFLSDRINILDFKKRINVINLVHNLWGFNGTSGQMFFNQLYNVCENNNQKKNELINCLKYCLVKPLSLEDAKKKINSLKRFIDEIKTSLQDKKKAPHPKSILYFLSYFWQIQNMDTPIFYNSLEQMLIKLDLLEQQDNLSAYYEQFYNVNSDMVGLMGKLLNFKATFWDVEHMLYWHHEKEESSKIKISSGKDVSVSIPEDEDLKNEQSSPPEKGERDSITIQAKLAEIGEKLKLKIWIPKSDRERVLKLWAPKEGTLVENLPIVFDEATLKTIRNIDILWIKNRSIIRAFEVEETTSIYSGILRMADLLALQPMIKINIHIVAPTNRREEVFKQISRPVFSVLENGPLSQICSYISYDNVLEIADEKKLEYMDDRFIENYTEHIKNESVD